MFFLIQFVYPSLKPEMKKAGVKMQKDLLQKIEEVRRNLNSLASAKSLVAPEVIKLSQRLDSLINQYYRYRYRSR